MLIPRLLVTPLALGDLLLSARNRDIASNGTSTTQIAITTSVAIVTQIADPSDVPSTASITTSNELESPAKSPTTSIVAASTPPSPSSPPNSPTEPATVTIIATSTPLSPPSPHSNPAEPTTVTIIATPTPPGEPDSKPVPAVVTSLSIVTVPIVTPAIVTSHSVVSIAVVITKTNDGSTSLAPPKVKTTVFVTSTRPPYTTGKPAITGGPSDFITSYTVTRQSVTTIGPGTVITTPVTYTPSAITRTSKSTFNLMSRLSPSPTATKSPAKPTQTSPYDQFNRTQNNTDGFPGPHLPAVVAFLEHTGSDGYGVHINHYSNPKPWYNPDWNRTTEEIQHGWHHRSPWTKYELFEPVDFFRACRIGLKSPSEWRLRKGSSSPVYCNPRVKYSICDDKVEFNYDKDTFKLDRIYAAHVWVECTHPKWTEHHYGWPQWSRVYLNDYLGNQEGKLITGKPDAPKSRGFSASCTKIRIVEEMTQGGRIARYWSLEKVPAIDPYGRDEGWSGDLPGFGVRHEQARYLMRAYCWDTGTRDKKPRGDAKMGWIENRVDLTRLFAWCDMQLVHEKNIKKSRCWKEPPPGYHAIAESKSKVDRTTTTMRPATTIPDSATATESSVTTTESSKSTRARLTTTGRKSATGVWTTTSATMIGRKTMTDSRTSTASRISTESPTMIGRKTMTQSTTKTEHVTVTEHEMNTESATRSASETQSASGTKTKINILIETSTSLGSEPTSASGTKTEIVMVIETTSAS